MSESEICDVAVDAEIDIEEKVADTEDADGIPIVAEEVDPMAALTGCRLELRFPTSWKDMIAFSLWLRNLRNNLLRQGKWIFALFALF